MVLAHGEFKKVKDLLYGWGIEGSWSEFNLLVFCILSYVILGLCGIMGCKRCIHGLGLELVMHHLHLSS